MHHPRKWNVTTSFVGLKLVTYTEISPKMVKPTDKAGNAEEEKRKVIVRGMRSGEGEGGVDRQQQNAAVLI